MIVADLSVSVVPLGCELFFADHTSSIHDEPSVVLILLGSPVRVALRTPTKVDTTPVMELHTAVRADLNPPLVLGPGLPAGVPHALHVFGPLSHVKPVVLIARQSDKVPGVVVLVVEVDVVDVVSSGDGAVSVFVDPSVEEPPFA